MTTKYVVVGSGPSGNQIITEFLNAQPAGVEAGYTEIDDSDPMYVDWQNYLSAKAAYTAGQNVVITSTGTSSLDGTYASDPPTRQMYNNQRQSIALDSTFLDGSTTLQVPDTSGALHAFDTANFTNFGKVVSQYGAQLDTAYAAIKADHSVAWNPPSNTITIP